MFMSLFIPALPPMQEVVTTPPAIIQTAANSAKPGMVFDGECNVIQTPDTPTKEDMGGFFPAQAVGGYFHNALRVEIDITNAKVTILKGPLHGNVVEIPKEEAIKTVGPEAGPLYNYRPNSGYLGPDDATLLIEISGKSYKTHVKFYVVEKVNDNNFYGPGTPATLCAESQSKRVATLTFNQDINLAQWGDIAQEIATSAGGMQR